MIDEYGGRNLAAVSSNTDYLLEGANAGPAKLAKADELGVKRISEDDFEAMLGADAVHGSGEADENIAVSNVRQQSLF